MRIDFKKKPTYSSGDSRLIKKFAWFPIICDRNDEAQSLIWLENYISYQKYGHFTDNYNPGYFILLTILTCFIFLIYWTIKQRAFKTYSKSTMEYSIELYKAKFPEFFNKDFNDKFQEVIK